MLGSLIAVNNPFPFSISGFTGLTTAQIISFFIVFVIFNAYVVLMVIALVAFYFTSKPRHGVVRTAAIWHFVAVLWMLMAFIGTVWGAPAEKTFLGGHGAGHARHRPASHQRVHQHGLRVLRRGLHGGRVRSRLGTEPGDSRRGPRGSLTPERRPTAQRL